MRDTIVLPNAPILVESTRAIGYSFESALADIIDNSIGKGAKNIDVFFESTEPQYIAVLDDGCGMTEDELIAAMRYGSKSSLEERENTDLGRFGLGLKTASLSQCRKLTVISKKHGKVCAAQWDIDYIIRKNGWVLKTFNSFEIKKFKFYEELACKYSGTVVFWENFDRMLNGASNPQKVFDEKIELARNHLALVFHRFMDSDNIRNRVKILFNNLKLEPKDPFLTNHPATQPLTTQPLFINGMRIDIKPYVLPYISKLSQKDIKLLGDVNDLRQNQGFYIYRNKRLIIWGTWFRLIKLHELNKLARVRVDIPNTLDSIWDIDVKKSTAALPDVIKESLANIVKDAVGRSERVYKYRGRKVTDDDLTHVWNVIDDRGSFRYEINRDNPIFKQLQNCLDDAGDRYLDSLIRMIEDAFPFNDVYYRLAKNEKSAQGEKTTQSMEFEKVYAVAMDMINSIKDINGDVAQFLSTMDKLDFFIKYPDVVKKVREDFASVNE